MSIQTLQGPLTAFDPPSSCFDQLWYNSLSDRVLGNPYDTSCKPSGWNTAVQYSPAFCPSSYVSASGRLFTAGTVTETVIDCCPSSFTADPGTYHCLSPIDVFSTAVFFTFSSDQSVFTTTITAPNFGINAHSIQVRYQSSDLSLLGLAGSATTTSATSPTSESVTTAPSPTSGSLATSTPDSVPTSSSAPTVSASHGLSTGAKAGIGIGIACGVILVLAVAYMVIRRRKSKSARANQPPQYEHHLGSPADKQTQRVQLSELAAPVSEIGDSRNLARSELPDTQRY